DFVIHNHERDVDIAQRGVDQMARANAKHIAIAADRHNGQVWACHLHALSHWQGAAMHAMEAEGADEVWEAAGAADARNHHRLVYWAFERGQRGVSGVQHAEVTAAGAPGWLYVAFEIFGCQCNGWLRHD